ncbi:MFS transporter, partial [Streptomyces sp. SID10116]|nr:MFS transporter [Streptomyces sp. SID10116]
AREVGAALGVAVTGTTLASHASDGFLGGMEAALRVVAFVVIAAAAVVTLGYGKKR